MAGYDASFWNTAAGAGLFGGGSGQSQYTSVLQQAEAERQKRDMEFYQQAMMQQLSALQIGDPADGVDKLKEKIASLSSAEAAHLSPPMPDHVATLTGWRGWKVNKNGLVALGQTDAWEPKKAVAARCTKGDDKHQSPAHDCTCGFWSFKSMDMLQEALKPYAGSVVVVGSVDIWGKVIECENGFRSEFAYPKELWLLKPDLDFLSWTYGVPVRKADVQKMDKDSSVTAT